MAFTSNFSIEAGIRGRWDEPIRRFRVTSYGFYEKDFSTASTKLDLNQVKQRKQNLKKYNTISFYKI